jgi:xanthine/CO dehydrogenase XdhC/CoxF family maturation factor
MIELKEILHRVAVDDGDGTILATLVDVQGSGSRLAGARMLIDRNGKSIGTVSGGCLEADILERARNVLQKGEPTVVSYDTTKDENSLFGLGMGCRGVVRVLLEPARNNNVS